MRSLLSAAALALAAAPLSAYACSVAAGYRVPTNMELVERADLILLGTVTAGDSDDGGQQMIAIEPVEALKGAMPSAPIALPAMIATDVQMGITQTVSSVTSSSNAAITRGTGSSRRCRS